MVNYKNGQAPYLNEYNLNLMQKIDTDTVTKAKRYSNKKQRCYNI